MGADVKSRVRYNVYGLRKAALEQHAMLWMSVFPGSLYEKYILYKKQTDVLSSTMACCVELTEICFAFKAGIHKQLSSHNELLTPYTEWERCDHYTALQDVDPCGRCSVVRRSALRRGQARCLQERAVNECTHALRCD